MKKYILSENTTLVCGIPLHRIIALVDIPAAGVRKGDLGGWIYSEECLSQEGDCWICRDAAALGQYIRIDGNAIVGNPAFDGESTEPITILDDNANVLNNARVSGKVVISDYGTVCQNAVVEGDGVEIYDCATVSGNAHVSGKARIGGYVAVTGEARVEKNALLNVEEYVCDGVISAPSQTRCSMFWGMMRAENGEYIIFKNAIDNLAEKYKDYVDLEEIEWALPDETQELPQRINDHRNFCHAIITYNETSGRLSFSIRNPIYWLATREVQIPFHEITEDDYRETDDISYSNCTLPAHAFEQILNKYFDCINPMWGMERNVYDEIITPRKYILTEPQEKTLFNPISGLDETHFVYKVRYLHGQHPLGCTFVDNGGFIESERNLTHVGDCSVEREAVCVGKACLYDNALLTDKAILTDESYACGNAIIGGEAFVGGHSEIRNHARVDEHATVVSAVIDGNARVSGFASVHTSAFVTGYAVVSGNANISMYAIISEHAHVSGGNIAHGERLSGNMSVVAGENVFEKNLLTIGRIFSKEDVYSTSFLIPRTRGNSTYLIDTPLHLTFNFTEVAFNESESENKLHGFTVANQFGGYFYFIPNVVDDTTTVYNHKGVKLADTDPFIEACWKIRLTTTPKS